MAHAHALNEHNGVRCFKNNGKRTHVSDTNANNNHQYLHNKLQTYDCMNEWTNEWIHPNKLQTYNTIPSNIRRPTTLNAIMCLDPNVPVCVCVWMYWTQNDNDDDDDAEVQFKSHQPKPPESVCSLPCEKGQAKKYVEGESCCWHCFNCSMYQVSEWETEQQKAKKEK